MKKDKKEKPKMYIASCSFGKDSIATILLALEHNEPLDRVVFSEVMFDHEKNISGEIPEHIEWVYKVAIPKLESMGVKVDVVRGKKSRKYALPLALTLGGGYGNFAERARKGRVTDFLYIPVKRKNAPIFNLADVAIWMGAFWLEIVSCSEKS